MMKKERRWLASAIAASASETIVMPWKRGARRIPATVKAVTPKSVAAAR
jgi:hypothetical protein